MTDFVLCSFPLIAVFMFLLKKLNASKLSEPPHTRFSVCVSRMSRITRDDTADLSRETKFSGANGEMGDCISSVFS